MIRCRVARAFVHAALERELGLEQRLELEQHTAGCRACAAFERRARVLQELLEGPGDPQPTAPDVDAAARLVLARLERGPDLHEDLHDDGAEWRPRRERRALSIAGAVLALAAAAAVVFVLRRQGPAPEPAPELAAPISQSASEPEWTTASVEASVRAALLELFESSGVDVDRAREQFVARMREPARCGWPVRRFVEGLLESPDAGVALGAARCLAALGEPSSIAALERILARRELAEGALEALGAFGEAAVPALERALAEPALASRSLLQLCRVGGARASAALERAARAAKRGSDPSREALLDALTTTGPAAVESLLRLAEEGERDAGRAESTAILARLPLVERAGAELARCVAREALPYDLAYRALLVLQPPEALPWLVERCTVHRERALALEAMASLPGLGPLRVALRLAEEGRVPRTDVLALLAELLERGLERDEERAEAFTRELVASGKRAPIHAWLELLIESEHPGAARALVPLVFCESLADDDRQWAALAVGELGTSADAELLLAESDTAEAHTAGLDPRPGERPFDDERLVAACLLSIHGLLGADGVERFLEPCSPPSVRRVLDALHGNGGSGEAVLVHRVARALDGALTELGRSSPDKKGIL